LPSQQPSPRFHPYAISVNRPQQIASSIGLNNQAIELARQPNSKTGSHSLDALAPPAPYLRLGRPPPGQHGKCRLFHLNPEQLFEPCTNIAVGSQPSRSSLCSPKCGSLQTIQTTALYALSVYNSGTYNLGFQNGYVAEVLKNAKP
jgi:hypothetical protein